MAQKRYVKKKKLIKTTAQSDCQDTQKHTHTHTHEMNDEQSSVSMGSDPGSPVLTQADRVGSYAGWHKSAIALVMMALCMRQKILINNPNIQQTCFIPISGPRRMQAFPARYLQNPR